jgi:hypothetical protein
VIGTTSQTLALGAVAEAQLGQPHNENGDLTVASNGTQQAGFGLVVVYADYTYQSTNTGGDPLKAEPTFDFSEQVEMVPTDRDINSNPILNSAGEAFENPGAFPLRTFIYSVTLNQPFYDATIAAQYLNGINQAAYRTRFGTYERGEVRFSSCLPAGSVKKSAKFVPVTYVHEIRIRSQFPNIPKDASPWDLRLLDQGKNARVSARGGRAGAKQGLAHIVDAEGQLVTNDVRLNGRGVPVESVVGGGVKEGGYNIRTGMSATNNSLNEMVNGPQLSACIVEASAAKDFKAFFLWYPMHRYVNFGALKLPT